MAKNAEPKYRVEFYGDRFAGRSVQVQFVAKKDAEKVLKEWREKNKRRHGSRSNDPEDEFMTVDHEFGTFVFKPTDYEGAHLVHQHDWDNWGADRVRNMREREGPHFVDQTRREATK